MITVRNHITSGIARVMAIALVFGIAGCSSSVDDRVAMIPSTSTAVMSMNVGQMSSKAISFSDLINSFSQDEEMAEAMEMIEESGIDFSGEMYGFVDTDAGLSVRGGVIIPLNDADDFTVFLRDISTEMNSPFTKLSTEGVNHAEIADGSALAIWDDNTALILNRVAMFTEDNDQLERALELFTEGADDPLSSDSDEFMDLMNEGHDMAVFINYEKIAPMAMMINPMVAQSGIKDMKVGMGMDFEDGEINMDILAHYDKAAARYLDLVRDDLDDDMLEGISSESPLGFASFALDPEKLYTMMDDLGLLDEIEREMRSEGLELEDLMEAMTGDVVVSVNGGEMRRPSWAPMDYAPSEPEPAFVAGFGLEDADEIEKVLERIVMEGGMVREGNVFSMQGGEAAVILEDDRLLIADVLSVEKLKEGNMEDLPSSMQDLATEHSSAFALDFRNMPKAFWDEIRSSMPDGQGDWAVENFPVLYMEAYAESPSGGTSASKMTIKTRDKGENALRTVLDYVKTMAEAQEAERQRRYGNDVTIRIEEL